MFNIQTNNIRGNSSFMLTLGTFRFQDEDDNEYEIWLPIFSENT